MGSKKLIRKMAIPAAIIFIVSILVLISQIPYRNIQSTKREEALINHINNLTQQYQKYLTETAAKIDSVSVDPKIISDVQSKILKENSHIKLYLWMTDNNEDFIFGSPTAVFNKVNTAYNKYEENIKNDGHFLNRNDFLENLIVHYNNIDFTEFESKAVIKNQNYRWRFYKEGSNGSRFPMALGFTSIRGVGFFQNSSANNEPSPRYLLSTPVTGSSGEVIGELYLKIDDYKNEKLYYNRNKAEREDLFGTLNPVFGIIAFISGLFLWFLLPTWVYTDARQRDVRSPGLWAFLSVISLFFGLTIYLITRPSAFKSFHCPQCENELNGTKAFCPHCGFDLAGTFCQQCQYPIKQSWQFCPNCRAGLGESKETDAKSEN
ncbi:zinc ribbon domain-containing protein [Thermodesulfobacteriota bacterium]